jgi:putative ABC transport system permease protein
MQGLAADLRQNCRALLRTPSFLIFTVLALALGIGANAAIFGLVDSVLLQPLQFRDSARLVEVWEDASFLGFPKNTPSPGNFAEWKKRNHVFSDMAALKGDIVALTGDGPPEQLESSPITYNLFPLLGVRPALGRNFLPEEDSPGGPLAAIISASLWRQRYGSDPSIVGRTIRLNGAPYQVVGVMPEGFTFPERASIWTPMALSSRDFQNFGAHYLRVFARMKPGVTLAAASREMSALAAQLAREHPDENTNIGAFAVSLRDQLVGDLRLGLLVLLGGVGCVLLIACANLAGLLLARSMERRRELAVRVALGAGRARLIVSAMLESLLLAFAGGALGLLLAVWALPALHRMIPLALAGWATPHLDWRLGLFTFGISAVAAILFGVVPAAKATRVDLNRALRQEGRSVAGGHRGARRYLVVGEVALATALVVGAGLFIRTLWALSHVDLGFRPDHVLTLRTNLPSSPGTPYGKFEARTGFYRDVLQKVEAIPGVKSAGYTTFLPLTNEGGTSGFTIEGRPPLQPEQANDATHRVISDDYLQTMGVKLISGRFFGRLDGSETRPVAIINETMANKYWTGENPLGHRFRLDENAPWITIVGIAQNVRNQGIERAARPEMYFPCTQPVASAGYFMPRDLAVRVAGDPLRFVPAVKQAIWSVDHNQPISDIQPMSQLVSDRLATRNMQVQLLGVFALMALLLASLGLYGLLAYKVAQRTREIGIRMALGAQKRQVIRTLLREGLQLVGLGLAGGLICAFLLQRVFRSLLFGVTPTDPFTFLLTAVILLLAGLAACYVPARRAASIDPVEALRYD